MWGRSKEFSKPKAMITAWSCWARKAVDIMVGVVESNELHSL